MHFRGKLYRALNPAYAREPLSGRGAALYGGRFNPKGTPALYSALSIMTAVKEVSPAGGLQPITLVSYEADFGNIFDARDETALAEFNMDASSLADPGWRDRMLKDGKAPTQIFAEQLIAQGYQGMLVRSFGRGASRQELNLVLWTWGSSPPAKLELIDDEH